MEDRYIGLQVAALMLSMIFTIVVSAQRQTQQGGVIVQSTPGVSQETRDALQDSEIRNLTVDVALHTEAIRKVDEKMTEVNNALQRLNTIGFGFGTLLSVLLAIDLYFRIRASVLAKMGPK